MRYLSLISCILLFFTISFTGFAQVETETETETEEVSTTVEESAKVEEEQEVVKKSKKDTSKTKNGSFVPLPAVFYGPETDWAFGGSFVYTFRFPKEKPESRASQIQFAAVYTLNKQFFIYIPYNLFIQDDTYRLYGEVGHNIYSYFYFGVGNNEPDNIEELYKVTFPRLRINALKKVRNNLFFGGRYIMDHYAISEVEEGGELASGRITGGTKGGLISGLGVIGNYDTRDFVFYPSKGVFLESIILYNSPVFGSDFNYTRYLLDARAFKSLSKNGKHILAFNAYGEFISGDPPFFQMASIGGRLRGRGYYDGRYRDRNMVMAQVEYRFPLFWRLSMAAFGNYGCVANKINEFKIDNFRYTYGGGLRFRIDEKDKVNVRMDYGVGKGTSGFYLTFGEAF